jgi:hypothetical protein
MSSPAELLPGAARQGADDPRALHLHEGVEDDLPLHRHQHQGQGERTAWSPNPSGHYCCLHLGTNNEKVASSVGCWLLHSPSISSRSSPLTNHRFARRCDSHAVRVRGGQEPAGDAAAGDRRGAAPGVPRRQDGRDPTQGLWRAAAASGRVIAMPCVAYTSCG